LPGEGNRHIGLSKVHAICPQRECQVNAVINYYRYTGGARDAKRMRRVVIEGSGRTGFVSELDEGGPTVY
jgi:hypothetical protein